MERAYEGNKTRPLAVVLGFIPVVPPLKTRLDPWQYDKDLYKRRNKVERRSFAAPGDFAGCSPATTCSM